MRTVGGEYGDLLTIPMNVASGWTTAAIGDMCSLDTTANFTVKDSVDDSAAPFGKVVALSPDGDVASVEIFGHYRAVRAFTTDGALAVGTSINVKGAGTNILETKAADAITLCISDPGGAGTAYVLV